MALAKQGIVFLEGKAGTIQEIFQNGAQNYYNTFGYFNPVVRILQKLFSGDFDKHLLVTDDVNDAAKFIEANPVNQTNLGAY